MKMLKLVLFLFICMTYAHASVGKIVLKKGDVHIQRADQMLVAENGVDIFEKDIVKTAAKSRVQIKFEDKTVITLGGNSEFNVVEYFNDAQKPKAKFGFTKGTFKSITGQIGKIAPQNFTLETKTATIGIRGTIVVGNIGESGDTIGCLLGGIAVQALGGTGSEVIVRAGEMTQVGSDGSGPQAPMPIDMGAFDGAGTGAGVGGVTGAEEGTLDDDGEGTPSSKAPSSADSATQTNLDDGTTGEVLEDAQTQQCPANYTGTPPNCEPINQNPDIPTGSCPSNSVGTYPNCQTINTTYQVPEYWTANLSDASISESKILRGYATGAYFMSGTYVFMSDGTFSLGIDGTTDTIPIATESSIGFSNNYIVDLTKTGNTANTFTYKGINEFSIQDFDSGVSGWIQSENTFTNEYVSWGYWQHDENNQNNLLDGLNFWVAGVDSIAAKNYIQGISAQTYTYTGKSIGYVYDDATDSYVGIDALNNNVVSLVFDFGSELPVSNASYIQFQTNESTPQVWRLEDFSSTSIVNGTFSTMSTVSIDGQVGGDDISYINGTFYGDQAQAVGGSFAAQSSNINRAAVGVFKAVRP